MVCISFAFRMKPVGNESLSIPKKSAMFWHVQPLWSKKLLTIAHCGKCSSESSAVLQRRQGFFCKLFEIERILLVVVHPFRIVLKYTALHAGVHWLLFPSICNRLIILSVACPSGIPRFSKCHLLILILIKCVMDLSAAPAWGFINCPIFC